MVRRPLAAVAILLALCAGSDCFDVQFLPRLCEAGKATSIQVDGKVEASSAGRIEYRKEAGLDPKAFNCSVTVASKEAGYEIVLSVTQFDVVENCGQHLYIKSEKAEVMFCDSFAGENTLQSNTFHPKDKSAIIRLKQVSADPYAPQLQIVYTAISPSVKDRSGKFVCPPTHFKCDNGMCIWKSQLCDRNNNCGDYSDEHVKTGDKTCEPLPRVARGVGNSMLMLIIFLPMSVLVLGVILLGAVLIRKRRNANANPQAAGLNASSEEDHEA